MQAAQDFDYVDEDAIQDELLCNHVCFQPLWNPVMHNKCHNAFCLQCIKSTEYICPLCRSGSRNEFYKVELRPFIAMLDKIRVKCIYCQKEFPRGQVEEHKQYCLITCPNGCGETITRENMHAHARFCMSRDTQIDFAFGSNGRFKQGRMDSPCCVAIDQNNNFLVTDSTNNCVHVFTELGIFVKSIGKQSALLGLLVTSDGRFSGPTGVLIDHYDNIVVADTKHNRIIMYDSDWNFLRKFGTKGNQDNEYDAPWGLAIDRSSRIFVSDMNNHRIVVLDINGKFLSEFGRHGSATGQFKKPKGIAILHNESIIIVDSHNHRLQMFNLATFQHVRTIGQKGTKDGQFMYPSCVTVGPNGTIIVSDTENNRVQIFDSRGGFLTCLSSKEVIEKPIGLCVNDYGHIVVVNSSTSRILVVK